MKVDTAHKWILTAALFIGLCLCLCFGLCFGLAGCGVKADVTVTGEDWTAKADVPEESSRETKEFFRDHLDRGAALFYDEVMAGVKNAGDEEYSRSILFEPEYVEHRELSDTYALVRVALQSDHPELFWLDDNKVWENGVEMYSVDDGSAKAVIHFRDTPKEDEVAAFERAVEDFMKDIDLNASEDQIALQIHDKLINMVTYDEDALELLLGDLEEDDSAEAGDGSEAGDSAGDDPASRGGDEATSGEKAFTAYGALVANSKGEEHHAVCQGYALAYQYLLGKAGIPAMMISGTAEDDEGENIGSAEGYGHAWNILYLSGSWYETDPTWDDYEFSEEKMEEDSEFRAFAEGAEQDPAYEEARHTYYNLTTSEMEDLVIGDECISHVSGYLPAPLRPTGDHSSHVRYTPEQDKTNGTLMEQVPIAKGTQFAY